MKIGVTDMILAISAHSADPVDASAPIVDDRAHTSAEYSAARDGARIVYRSIMVAGDAIVPVDVTIEARDGSSLAFRSIL